jgi:hypothetical protein
VLTFSITLEDLQAIAGELEVIQRSGRVEHRKFPLGLGTKGMEGGYTLTLPKLFGLLACERSNQGIK